MDIGDCTVGMGITGSFCSFGKATETARTLTAKCKKVVPVYSYNAQMLNTRFGNAGEFMGEIKEITGEDGIKTLQQAERVGPEKMFDVMLIYPCTGNTAAKLANGINDDASTMAVKSHLRNGNPVVVAISTNDAMSGSAENIGKLLNRRNYYFVPFRQDNPITKPASLVFAPDLILSTIEKALDNEQIQPVLV